MTNPTNQEARTTFDANVRQKIEDFAATLQLEHPEVAAFAGIVTWRGALNDAGIFHGVWSAGQQQSNPAVVVASLWQTLKMIDHQFQHAARLIASYQERLEVLGTELLRREHEKREEAEKGKAPGP